MCAKTFMPTQPSIHWLNNQKHFCRCVHGNEEHPPFSQDSHAVLAAHTHNGNKIALNNQNTQRHIFLSDWK